MQDPFEIERPIEAPRPIAAPSRSVLHVLLAATTFVTLVLAGWFFWEPGDLAADLLYGTLTFVILGSHELGHYVACRLYGVRATLPYFIPGLPPIGSFGALIRIRGPIPHRRALFDIAAAGPIAGFVVALPVLAIGLSRATVLAAPPAAEPAGMVHLGEPLLLQWLGGLLLAPGDPVVNGWIGAGWVGLFVTSLNLFPVGQLDGGHAVYAVSRRLHRVVARGTLVTLAGLILFQALVLRQFPFYVAWLVILLWMRDRHPRLVDEAEPLGAARVAVGLALGMIFVLSFIRVPLYLS